MSAAVAPCRIRAAISSGVLLARPHSNEAAVNVQHPDQEQPPVAEDVAEPAPGDQAAGIAKPYPPTISSTPDSEAPRSCWRRAPRR